MIMFFFFFFKQKTAYEMRISDWSSDVCSSDLRENESHRSSSPSRSRICHSTARRWISSAALSLITASFVAKMSPFGRILIQKQLRSRNFGIGSAQMFLDRAHADAEIVGDPALRLEIGRAHV